MNSSLQWLPRILIGAAVLAGVLYFLPTRSTDSDDDYRLRLGDFALIDQAGQKVTSHDLLGKVWIASFVFTRCAGPCPQVSATMARLQKEVAEQPDVRLVTISVDPERDDPNELKNYAERYGADPSRWLFLTGSPAEVQRLLREGFRVAAEPAPGQKHSMTHSTKLALVDRSGWIRGYFDSLPNRDDENVEQSLRDFDRNLQKLREKVAALLLEGN